MDTITRTFGRLTLAAAATLAALLCTTVPGDVLAQGLADGTVAYWGFDEGSGTAVADSAGANNGTVNGAEWATGRKGGALLFDGSDSVVVPDSAGLDIAKNSISIEAWFNPSVDVTAMESRYPILLIKRPWLKSGYAAHFQKQGGALIIQYCWDGGSDWQKSTTAFKRDTWYHYVGIIDGNTLKVYINGVLESTKTTAHTVASSAGAELTIGLHFQGLIDEVAVYDKVLSPEIIRQHYDNGLAGRGYSAADTMEALVTAIEGLGLSKGIATGLVQKVKNALKSHRGGKKQAAKSQLGAFISEVEAQSGNKIEKAQADKLVGTAKLIIPLL